MALSVDHAMRVSAPGLGPTPVESTRRDDAVSESGREGERPAGSCHSGVQLSRPATSQNVPPYASDRSRGLGMWPRTVQGQPVEGVGG